jgi:ArsR family transcriptional regulator
MSNNRINNAQEYANIFKALSNPNRLKIFLRLVSCCAPGDVYSHDLSDTGIYVGELGKDLGIVPSTVSHHIKELYRAGLIRMERRGQRIECWVDPEVIRDLRAFFSG